MTLKEFEERLQTHDWLYDMSDDHLVWSKGDDNLSQIKHAIKTFNYTEKIEAERLFNFYRNKNIQLEWD